jgi:hypothetical protein
MIEAGPDPIRIAPMRVNVTRIEGGGGQPETRPERGSSKTGAQR